MADYNLLVDRLFLRFGAVWGAPKVAAMWASVDQNDLRRVWGGALSRFSVPTITKAVEALPGLNSEWPPTLAQFVELCRQYNRPEQRPVESALPAPGDGVTDDETARANLAKIREMLAGALKGKVIA